MTDRKWQGEKGGGFSSSGQGIYDVTSQQRPEGHKGGASWSSEGEVSRLVGTAEEAICLGG